jgi:trk system potassium uptake protein TrkA
MKSYVVIGLGRFGSEVARQLYKCGCEVLAIDIRNELVQHISQDVTHAAVADSRDKEVLRMLGVGDFDCAVVAIGEDLATSVLVTMNLKEMGIPHVVCKAHDGTHRRILEKLGANQVVIPEQENAARLAKSLSAPNLLDYIELSEEYSIVELPAPQAWFGKTLRELNVRAKLGVNILAVRRDGKMDISPAADFSFQTGDIIVVLGDAKALKAVQKL